MNESGIVPLGHRVLVKPLLSERMTDGGIVIPESMADKNDKAQIKAVVVAVGETAWADSLLGGKPWAHPGDTVIIGKYAGVFIDGKDGGKYRIVNDDELQARIEV